MSVEDAPARDIAATDDYGWISDLFSTVDRQAIEENMRYLTPDVRFRFGNADPIHGQDALVPALQAFYASIGGLHHDLVGVWRHGQVVTVEADVTYTRLDGGTVTIPVLSLLRLAGPRLVGDFRIFFDPAPIYAP